MWRDRSNTLNRLEQWNGHLYYFYRCDRCSQPPPSELKPLALLLRRGLMSQASWIPAPQRPGIPPYYILDKEIEKSEHDDRLYRSIRLENGLKATLVHDVTADKAAASLDVAVGHLSDPVHLLSNG